MKRIKITLEAFLSDEYYQNKLPKFLKEIDSTVFQREMIEMSSGHLLAVNISYEKLDEQTIEQTTNGTN